MVAKVKLGSIISVHFGYINIVEVMFGLFDLLVSRGFILVIVGVLLG